MDKADGINFENEFAFKHSCQTMTNCNSDTTKNLAIRYCSINSI